MNLLAITRTTGTFGRRLLAQGSKKGNIGESLSSVFDGVTPEIAAKCRFQEKTEKLFKELREGYSKSFKWVGDDKVYATEEEINTFFKWLSADEKRLLRMIKYKKRSAGEVMGANISFMQSDLESQKNIMKALENPEMEALFDSMDGKFNMSLQPIDVVEILQMRPKQIKNFGKLVERAGGDGIDRHAVPVILDELAKKNKLTKHLLKLQQSEGKYLLTDTEIADILKISREHKDVIENLAFNKEYQLLLKAVDENYIDVFKNENLLQALVKNVNKNANYISVNGTVENCHLIQGVNRNGVVTQTMTELRLENGAYKAYKDEHVIHSANLSTAKKELYNGDHLDVTIKSERRVKTENDMKNPNSQSLNPTVFMESEFEKSVVDASGKVKKTIVIKEAEVPGQYNMTTYIGGKENPNEVIHDATARFYGSKKQGVKVERHLTSPSGTKTDYRIIQGPKGSGMDYTIQNAEGKVIAKLTRRSRQLSENHYVSTLNGEKYDIKFDGNNVIVSKFDKDGKFVETIKLDEQLLDPNLNDLYRKLPGDYFFALRDAGCKTEFNQVNWESIIHQYARSACTETVGEGEIIMSSGWAKNGFVFSHELGHVKDSILCKKLRDSENIQNAFKRDWRASHEQSSLAETRLMAYFSPVGNMFSQVSGAGESLAEAEGLFSGLLNTEFNGTGMRTILFQKDIADTIAEAAKKFYTQA